MTTWHRLLAPIIALPLLAGCGSHPATIDQHGLESQIKAWVAKQPGSEAGVTVKCPSDVAIHAGTNFHCIVTDQAGTSIRLTVTIENDKGYVTWSTD